VIAGLNTQAQGESAVLAITATQIGFPAYVLLNLLAGFKAFRFQPTEQEAISRAIAHDQRIGLQAKPLVLQRWEEGWEKGWEKPLSEWREELAIPMATGETFSANYA
jgi:ubiquinone biosynthesis protein Coq4